MSTDNRTDGLQFVDPSVDPSVIWDLMDSLFEIGLGSLLTELRKVLWRFLTVEYAVGFDGVDDWICIDELDMSKKGVMIESDIWIQQNNEIYDLLDIVDSDGDSILRLTSTSDENSEIQAVYRHSDGMQNVVLPRVESGSWQNLRIQSNRNNFSIEVDETSSVIRYIAFENGPIKFYFGRGHGTLRYFRGMIKQLHVASGGVKLFNLQSGERFKIEEGTDSSDITGIHDMKKDRLQKSFSSP
ncbi:hypothetical protein ACT4ML_19860 [Natrinema sp. LN54]|uniref:hypothetical protein n=1 Tax=Natrinema sp. LN54 TaxID=3458705 RepID=UPI004035A557